MKLGDKILELRKKQGLSQEQLGEKINVTRQTISNWELGETSPNPEQLKLLSKELNVSVDELLDNDIKNILVEKVSNTEELASLILKIIKITIAIIVISIVLIILLAFLYKSVNSLKDTGREITESIHCEIYGEEHSYSVTYQELTGTMIGAGGDSYFYDILDLKKYDDPHQILNVINDYVKKNGGTCERIEGEDISDIVDMTIKEGTLTKTSATVIIKERVDYDIVYGEPFWIEKYDNKANIYTKLPITGQCAFILPAYSVTPNKQLELTQDWSCMYGKLDKGMYRLVKDVLFDDDNHKKYSIWVDFEITD